MNIKLLISIVIELEVLLWSGTSLGSNTKELTSGINTRQLHPPRPGPGGNTSILLRYNKFLTSDKVVGSLATVILFPVTAVTTPEPPRADSGLVAPVPTTNPIVSNYSLL